MMLDTSALVAVIRDEPERRAFLAAMLAADELFIAAPTLLELGMVVDGARDPVVSRKLDDLLAQLHVQTIAFDDQQSRIARAAFRDYGKGSGHPARLNFGDCIAYAAARATAQPLLFKGDGFVHTDVVSAA